MAELPFEVDCVATKAQLDAGGNSLLLDCREPDEYALVKIEGAKLLPMSELADRVAELEPYRDQSIIVHCHHGGRSMTAATGLRQLGFSGAQSMAGGIDEWSLSVNPAVPRY